MEDKTIKNGSKKERTKIICRCYYSSMRKNSILIVSWIAYIAILSVIWYLRFSTVLSVAFAVVGSAIGFLFPIVLDVLLPKIIDGSVKAETSFAKDVLQASADQLKQGNIHSTDAPETPLRSYPLLFAYFVAAIFVITSTQNWFGKGFVLGLGFSLVGDIFTSRVPMTLRERWFSVFRTNLTDVELKYFVWVTVAAFGLISFLSAMV